MTKKINKNLLKQKKFVVLGLIICLLVIVSIYLNIQKTYSNTEYNYSFNYPKSANINFISSLNDSLNISEADTISVSFKSGSIMGLQINGLESLCYVKFTRPSNYLCIFSNRTKEDFLKDTEIQHLIKTIKF